MYIYIFIYIGLTQEKLLGNYFGAQRTFNPLNP